MNVSTVIADWSGLRVYVREPRSDRGAHVYVKVNSVRHIIC